MDASAADYLRAVVLGVIQAVTEFLPVSSSGHLIVGGRLFGEDVSSLTFDVGLHIGTMVAVIGYFWRDWTRMASAAVYDIATEGPDIRRWQQQSRLGVWIALGTIPAVVVGLLFEERIDQHLREPWVVATMLIVFAGVISIADRWGGTLGRLLDMTPGRSFAIGVAQAMALIPGVSRSGATIAMGRFLGFDRESAARFSFLLSAPVVFGAGVLQFIRAVAGEEVILWGPLVVGAVVAAGVGALVIRGFLGFLQSRTLQVFVWYRIALGLAIFAALAAGIL